MARLPYFTKLFNGIIFYKVEVVSDCHVYAAHVASPGAEKANAHIRIFVPAHIQNPDVAEITTLDILNYESIMMTYCTNNKYNLRQQYLPIQSDLPNVRLNIIDQQLNGTTATTIVNGVECKVTLLHDAKKQSKYQWKNNISLSSALYSFKAIVIPQESGIQLI